MTNSSAKDLLGTTEAQLFITVTPCLGCLARLNRSDNVAGQDVERKPALRPVQLHCLYTYWVKTASQVCENPESVVETSLSCVFEWSL